MTAERTYMASWSQALRVCAFVFGINLLIQLPSVLRGKPNASWTVILAVGAVTGALIGLAFRSLLKVRVSNEGIRGVSARVMKWNEVTEVVGGHSLFGGVVVSSTSTPSIMVVASIASNPEFRQHVLGLIAADHPLAKQFSATGTR